MRQRAEWMAQADEQILEYLRDYDAGSPSKIAEVVRLTPSWISKRCSLLASYGLVRDVGNGTYMLTDDGRAFLAEELDATQLEPDESGS